MPSPRCRSWFLLAALTAVAAGGSILLAQPGSSEAPAPIQWIFLEPAQAAKEMEKVPQGTLLLFPRKDFEDRLERVRKAVRAREQKPRLTNAHYNAELIDRSFTNGSGQWTILYAGAAPSVLPIDPLNLALSKLKWDEGGDAILAELDGKSLGLLVNKSGTPTCLFDWSARGTPANDGITFNLAVPFCPLTTFEFKLPADYWLAAPKGAAVVTGPHEAETPAKRLWKVQITGSKQLELTVRKITEGKGQAPTIFARVQSTQQLAPDRLLVRHEYQIDVLNGSIRELVLEGDGSLQPYNVLLTSGEVKSWQWKEVAAKKDPNPKVKVTPASGLLTIQFRQPVQGRIEGLRVHSLASRPSEGLWTSQALRVRDALPRGETLELRLHPDFAVGKWDHGSFQPTNLLTETDGTQVLTLAETAPNAAISRRPTLILPTKGIDLHTTEKYAWQIDPRGATLTGEIHYALARGHLPELHLKMPTPKSLYQIEALEMKPADLLRGWRLDGNVLVVELKQSLTPAKKATLKVELRAGVGAIATGVSLPYPKLEPTDGTKREGSVAIHVDPIFQSQLMPPLPPLATLDENEGDKRTGAQYRFAFRDQSLNAVIRLARLPVQAHLQGKHTLTLSEKHALLQFRWEAEPIVGAPEFLDFRCPPGFPPWKVKQEDNDLRIHHWERLHVMEALPRLLSFGSPHGLHAAGVESMLQMVPASTQWRFHLAEPLRKKSSFTIEAVAPAGLVEDDWRQVSLLLPSVQPLECVVGALSLQNRALLSSSGAKVWSMPLMTPVQRRNVDETIVIDSPREPISKVAADGAFEAPAGAFQADKAPTNLVLHQKADTGASYASKVTLWTNPAKRSTSQVALCDEAKLATYVHRDGRIYQRIQFRLWHWRDRTFDVHLPARWQILAVKVHEQWLDRLDVEPSGPMTRLTVPVDQAMESVGYEILARWQPEGELLPGLQKITVPRIQWPIVPMDMQTRLFLENGLTPLDQESLSPVGVPRRIARQSETPRWLRQAWSWGQSWWPVGAQVELRDKLDAQKHRVLLAESQLRGNARKPIRLSEALDRFALHHLKEAAPLVIDRVALRSLGLSSGTMISLDTLSPQAGRPFWEKLKLVYVPCPSGALLTSPQRLQSFGINPDDPLQVAELDDAVREAILHGRDSSGGFYSILAWLKLPAAEPSGGTAEPAGVSPSTDGFQEMTEWAVVADGAGDASFLVVDSLIARCAGWLLAILTALVLWKVQRGHDPIGCFRLHVLLLGVSILIVIWAPLPVREFFVLPTFLVEIAGILCCVARLVRQRGDRVAAGQSTISHPGTTAALLGLILLGVSWSATAQAPAARYPVFVIGGGAKPAVLVPPDLIAKLDELETQPVFGPASAVLVSAKYTGKIKDTQAKIDVLYEIHSFKDKSSLLIPLTGVQLGEGAFLDGAPVFPAPHKNGYVLPIRDKGPHHLRLTFSVRANALNDQLDLRFAIPKLIQNDINLQWLTPVPAVHCLRSWGEDKTYPDVRKEIKEWSAQLGYENDVHLRWSSTIALPSPKAIDVKEAHFWDLHPGSLALWSSFHYALAKGSLAQLVVSMPEGLDVRSVEALATPPVIVKHWNVLGKGGQRRLIVDLAQPATGNLTLNLEIVPQGFAQKSEFLLPLPAPLQGASKTGLLGYRLEATEVPFAQNLVAVQSIPMDEFLQQWKKQGGPALPPGTRAKSFQRSNAQQAGMRLLIEPTTRKAAFQLRWNLDHQYADVQGKFTIESSQQDLFFLEFFIDPSIILADVAGPDVQRWHRQDALLQVWLRQPRKETTLEMAGWRSRLPKAGPGKSFALPCIYPLKTTLTDAIVEVRPASRIHLQVEGLRGLRADAADKNRFHIDKTPYDALFSLSTESAPPAAAILTKVHTTDQSMEVWIGIRLTTQRGELPTVKLHLKDWPHEPLSPPDAPGAVVLPIEGKGIKHQAWTLKYPPGLPQEVFVTLRARVPKDANVSLPVVELDHAAVVGRWLAWRDVEMVKAGGKNLTHQRSVNDKLAPYQTDAWFKDSRTWNFAEQVPSLQAVRPKTPARTSVHILASTEDARLTGAGEWLHEASFWVQAPERAELRVKFPAPVEACSVWTDRRLQSALHSAPLDFVVPVEAGSEPRLVELRWKYVNGAERIGGPNIAAVQIDQVALPAHERIVWVANGMSRAKPDAQPTPTYLARLLHEAQCHMQIAAALGQEPARSAEITKRIGARQQNFYACLRQAEHSLSILKFANPDFDETASVKRLRELKDTNNALAKERRYDEQRKIAEKSKKDAPLAAFASDHDAAGIPLLLTPDMRGLTLQSATEQASSERRTRSELILLGAIFLLVFSYFRHGWSILGLAAPEITIALTVTAMALYGISLIGIFLIGCLLLVRSFWIAAAWKKRSRQAASAAAEAGPPSNVQPPPTPAS